MKFASIIVLGTASLTVAQHHNHAHRHAARHGSPLEARIPTTTATVPGPIITVYELNGEDVSWKDVEAGLKDGKYVLVGDKISTVIPKPSTKPTPKPTPSPSPPAAKFFEKPTTTPAAPPPPSTSAAPKSSAPAVHAASTDSSVGGGDIDADFPSGIKCSEFPSQYGALPLEYLKLGGWTGVQRVPGFSMGDAAISYIETAIKGEGCTRNSFCSYACPAGYQKTQWPEAQGAKKESIGGLFCNSNGVLELSRGDVSKKLCEKGLGGVKMINKLGTNAAFCRTDYPGSESETVPVNTQPGGTYEVCNPDQTTYYQWNGAPTSAQYYLNNAGVSQANACDWNEAGSNAGNWAPVNFGVGRGADKVTYISLFPNAPTNPDGKLNFNVEIKGDVSGGCAYRNGQYYKDDVPSSSGCTVGVREGGEAYFELS